MNITRYDCTYQDAGVVDGYDTFNIEAVYIYKDGMCIGYITEEDNVHMYSLLYKNYKIRDTNQIYYWAKSQIDLLEL
jgi:hypothetical protein